MNRANLLGWHLTLFCLTGSMSAWAGDVVLDNFTIGNLADDTALTPANSTFDIHEQLGQRFADNLFHSFFSFNIDNGETARFSGDPAIQNIISRVTGGSPSTIDGTVESTIDGAGFWFVNPAGMIINSNAMFDVSGSLALGAADFVEFENAERWYAFAPPAGETSTFSVAAPATFGFLDSSASGILEMSGVTLDELSAPDIDDFLITGGTVTLDDTILSTLDDILITGGTVTLDDTILSTLSGVEDGGDITIFGGDVSLNGGTQLIASTVGARDAGDIFITGTNSVTAEGGTPVVIDPNNNLRRFTLRIVSASGDTEGTGDPADLGTAGNVTIEGGTVQITNTEVVASTRSTRRDNVVGSVRIESPGEIMLENSRVSSDTFGDSRSGSVEIRGGDVLFLDGTAVTANTRGTGAAGAVTIHGANSVRSNLDADGEADRSLGVVLITTTSNHQEGDVVFIAEGTSGAAGTITITGGEIRLANTRVRAATFSDRPDNARASIRIKAQNEITLIDSRVVTQTEGGSAAGDIAIEGADVSLRKATVVRANTTGTGDAGDILISGTNSVTAQGNGRTDGELRLRIASVSGDSDGQEASDLGAAGNVTIKGGTIRLFQARVLARTSSNQPDNALGSVRIEAPGNEITLIDSVVSSDTFGDSAAGPIDISGGDVLLLDGTEVTANTRGTGAAGAVTIHGANSVRANLDADGEADGSLDDVLITSTSADSEGEVVFIAEGTSGAAGTITITGGEIRLANTLVRAVTESDRQDNARASIRIKAQNEITLIDSRVVASTEGGSAAGDIAIEGADVSLRRATVVRANTTGTGDAGNILISGTNSVTAQGNGRDDGELRLRIASTSGDAEGTRGTSNLGAAGIVTIKGGTIRLTQARVLARTSSNQSDNALGSVRIEAPGNEITLIDSEVSSDTFGDSAAGPIDISGGDISLLDGTSVSANTTGVGKAGEISITANELTLTDGASISTSAQSTGNAGSIAINVSGDLSLIGGDSPPSRIATDSRISEGGNIAINTSGRLLARNGSILASAGALGTGGNIALQAAEIVLQESKILAKADEGRGGQIDINSSITGQELVFVRDSLSQISADSNAGNAGTITISAPDTDINSAIRTQDVNLFDAPVLTADACSPAAWESRSSLVVEDRGGVPPAPDGYFPGSVASTAPQAGRKEVESEAHIDTEGGVTTVAVASLPVAAGCM